MSGIFSKTARVRFNIIFFVRNAKESANRVLE